MRVKLESVLSSEREALRLEDRWHKEKLASMAADVARRMDLSPPDRITIEEGPNAGTYYITDSGKGEAHVMTFGRTLLRAGIRAEYLESIIAHELSHKKHGDSKNKYRTTKGYMAARKIATGAILGYGTLNALHLGKQEIALHEAAVLAFAIAARVTIDKAHLIGYAVSSRRKELRADAEAVKVVGAENVIMGLISIAQFYRNVVPALEKVLRTDRDLKERLLESCTKTMEMARHPTAWGGATKAILGKAHSKILHFVYDTHPSMEKRIKKMAQAGIHQNNRGG